MSKQNKFKIYVFEKIYGCINGNDTQEKLPIWRLCVMKRGGGAPISPTLVPRIYRNITNGSPGTHLKALIEWNNNTDDLPTTVYLYFRYILTQSQHIMHK